MFHRSRASNDPTWPKSNARDFMLLPDTCKFEKAVIKTESDMPRTMSNMFFFFFFFFFFLFVCFFGVFFYHSRASNSKKSCTVWLKFELVRDFMLVLVIRKFDQI